MTDENQNQNEVKQEKHAGGRPTAFREIFVKQAYMLALLGARDKDLADFFNVCEDTINEWKKVFPEFSESLKKGKTQADAEVAEKLYHRAKGYSHPEEKIFCHEGKVIRAETTKHYPPDTAAAIIWLKNRQGLYWRDNQEVNLSGQLSFGPVQVTLSEPQTGNIEPNIVQKEQDVSANEKTD